LKHENIEGLKKGETAILKVVGTLTASSLFRGHLKGKEAVRVMTGAILPKGCDTVVRQEKTERVGEGVRIPEEVVRGIDIRKRGSDLRKGMLIIQRGEQIGPMTIGILASIGRVSISVFQRPRISLLATGDELLDIDEPLRKGSLYQSNVYSLEALVLEEGAIPVRVGIAPDDKEVLRKKLINCFGAEIICTTGGVSVGDRDFTQGVLEDLGWERAFWRVGMRPGYPLAFGRIQGRPIFCLPGNPHAVRVVFEELIRPALRKIMGHSILFRKTVEAELVEGLARSPGMRHFIPGFASLEKKSCRVAPLSRKEGLFMAMKRANALIVFPEDRERMEPGESVCIRLLSPLL
jgi:molybdopterin molybdotransferase